MSDIEITCIDTRWDPNYEQDFTGQVRYEETNSIAEFDLKDGYIVCWKYENKPANFETDIQVHNAALQFESDSRSGLGFNRGCWVSVVRRIFIFVSNYDIRPHTTRGRGHKGLCSSAELIGNDIWVTVKSRTASNPKSKGVPVVKSELRDIIIKKSRTTSQTLVKISGSMEDSSFKGHEVAFQTGLRNT